MYECVHQPFKGLYLCYQLISTIFIRVPIWSLWYLLPSNRPRSTWSWGHAMILGLARHVVYISSFTGNILPQPDHRALAPTKEAEGVWVDGVPSELILDELKLLASISEVAPERIPGYWYGRSGTPPKPTHAPQLGEKVFFFFHAGGFTHVSAHPDYSASIMQSLVELDRSVPRAFALEYRLSSTHPSPEHFPFPAALLDCLSGYYYLVKEIGYEPSDIILVGASAGGNLALALCRYLVEHKNLPRTEFPAPPGNLLLLSPWADIGNSHDWPGSSSLAFDMDFLGDLNSRSMLYSKQALLGPYGFGFATLNRYVSPASLHPSVHAHFRGFPRTFIAVGTAERFLDQIRTLRKKMDEEMGEGEVTFFEARDAVHDYLLFKWHPHRPGTLKAITMWLSESP
ncbi:Alpha/Beta hydrolase protein [Suillus clintonianus]|uniref:Alpha/Beta hydrolase protein n=1 Tax=Suillus clintonianus TaxID=1904413 RepID=UPI001B884A2D|nr:Alpha/Beta hydrolase protein [Suillus clintonianus]KAG2150507.1 Alpha/Beta hydrolase protein [Suillus clintonianus]